MLCTPQDPIALLLCLHHRHILLVVDQERHITTHVPAALLKKPCTRQFDIRREAITVRGKDVNRIWSPQFDEATLTSAAAPWDVVEVVRCPSPRNNATMEQAPIGDLQLGIHADG